VVSRLDTRKGIFYSEDRHWHCGPESCGCPIPGGAQGRVGWDSGQPELVGGSLAHGRVLELDNL